ncbi:MAG: 30S ribosomal protein S17 [Thermoanaerobaculia bacterium]|nr:30S ribosomal protein S17 [Thermoanaerobaculia bacterium]
MQETETAAAPKRRHTMVGTVIDSPMDKTAIVAVEKPVIHELYQRRFKRTAKFYAHDPDNETRAGDRVLLVATRPLSKTKRWRVEEILERGEEV